jgi:hypothetical protein
MDFTNDAVKSLVDLTEFVLMSSILAGQVSLVFTVRARFPGEVVADAR